MNIKFITLSFSLLLSLSLVSNNLSSGPFDKLGVGKGLLDKVIDDKKEKEEEKKREQENQKREQESQKRKEEQKSSERKIVQDFYNLFSDRGTKVITETTVTRDDFGDEQKEINHYILVNDTKFRVYVPPGVCPSDEYYDNFDLSEKFPFRVSKKFDNYLNYEKSGYYLGHVHTKYKLSDGTKGSHWNGVTTVKSEMKWFLMGEGTDEPLSLNMVSYRKLLQTDPETSGELTMVIVGKTDSKNIMFTLNPFHSSWLNLYKSHCKV
tara:strand:+ start:438 stop:1232 length:795 start_codon:yes stop_codon:yes gene_type:complete